ncbi:MAG: endonuclease III [Nitrospirae bacterium]|nr:endonuclease III [Nitrospirota bacterium]MBI3351445.1 endonuclease III [Nitrospirota bacterium]
MIESKTLLKLFDQAIPEPEIELKHSNPLELLVATILSAQCTDERVNKVTEVLFKKYKTAQDYAKADPAIFEKEIQSTGFYKNKAKNVIAAAQAMVKQYQGNVPNIMEELTTLPGVGRKTANVILGGWFKQPAIVVDTHVKRVSKRLGLTESEDPEVIEKDLQKLFPREKWTKISHQILLFGRYSCKARSPKCEGCKFYQTCISKGKW